MEIFKELPLVDFIQMDIITMSSIVQKGLILRDRIKSNGNVIQSEHNPFFSINRKPAR